MDNNLEKLYEEAIQLFKEKKYEKSKEILEILVSSEYLPAFKMLAQVYTLLGDWDLADQIDRKLENANNPQVSTDNYKENNDSIKATKESESFNSYPGAANIDKKTIENYNQSYKNEDYYENRKRSFIFDPSNILWLNIVLYSNIFLELLLFIASLIVAITMENILYFLLGCLLIVLMHLITMITLNLSFNVQSLKDDVKELKDNIKYKN